MFNILSFPFNKITSICFHNFFKSCQSFSKNHLCFIVCRLWRCVHWLSICRRKIGFKSLECYKECQAARRDTHGRSYNFRWGVGWGQRSCGKTYTPLTVRKWGAKWEFSQKVQRFVPYYQFVDFKLVLSLKNVIRNAAREIHRIDRVNLGGVGGNIRGLNLHPHLLFKSGVLNEYFHKTFKDLCLIISL